MACRLPDCRALHLRICWEPIAEPPAACVVHCARTEVTAWFFVKRAQEECCAARSAVLRTLPMDPAQRLVLREHDGTARCGDGCVVQVLSLELAPLADKHQTVYMAHDYESLERDKIAKRREALERASGVPQK